MAEREEEDKGSKLALFPLHSSNTLSSELNNATSLRFFLWNWLEREGRNSQIFETYKRRQALPLSLPPPSKIGLQWITPNINQMAIVRMVDVMMRRPKLAPI